MTSTRYFRPYSLKSILSSINNNTRRTPVPRYLALAVVFFLTFLSSQLADMALDTPFAGRAFAATGPFLSVHPSTFHLFQPFLLAHRSLPASGLPFSRPISSGVTYSTGVLMTAAGLVLVHTLDIDLTDPHIRLSVVQAHNSLVSHDETVSSMADRTGAVAGVNGDYFEEGGPGRPIGMVAINGQLLQSPAYYAVLGITSAGTLTMNTESFSGDVTDGQSSYPLSTINVYNQASKGNLVLITPQLGLPPPILGDHAVLLQPISANTFLVRSLVYSTSLAALAGTYALIGSGNAAVWLIAHLHKGDLLSVRTSVFPDAHLMQAIGGGPLLIKHGAPYHDPNPPNPKEITIRNPLTAISVNRSGTLAHLVVFDGRGAGPMRSVGLTEAQATSYLLAQGAYAAMLFDTGGSTDMVARFPGQRSASVVNWPSDGHERPVGNGLFIFSV